LHKAADHLIGVDGATAKVRHTAGYRPRSKQFSWQPGSDGAADLHVRDYGLVSSEDLEEARRAARAFDEALSRPDPNPLEYIPLAQDAARAAKAAGLADVSPSLLDDFYFGRGGALLPSAVCSYDVDELVVFETIVSSVEEFEAILIGMSGDKLHPTVADIWAGMRQPLLEAQEARARGDGTKQHDTSKAARGFPLLLLASALYPTLKDALDSPKNIAPAALWTLTLVIAWLLVQEAHKP
jgi:hypothetical protein